MFEGAVGFDRSVQVGDDTRFKEHPPWMARLTALPRGCGPPNMRRSYRY